MRAARAARLFFLTRPIKFLICGVLVAVAVLVDEHTGTASQNISQASDGHRTDRKSHSLDKAKFSSLLFHGATNFAPYVVLAFYFSRFQCHDCFSIRLKPKHGMNLIATDILDIILEAISRSLVVKAQNIQLIPFIFDSRPCKPLRHCTGTTCPCSSC